MSYILEALRRAETERERKRRVPGLLAQPVPVVSTEEPAGQRSKAWWWVVVGVSAGVLVPLLWRSWPSDQAAEEAASARTAVAGSVAPHSGPVAAEASVAPAVAPAAAEPATTHPPAATAPTQQEPPRAAHAVPTTPKARATTKPGAAHTPHEPAARPPTTMTTTQTPTAGATPNPAARPTPASAPEPRLRSLAELPEELKRSVPPLAFGGSVYSDTAAQRMVIFNGQVLREGDAVTDDLVLEQIRPRSAVMRLRGQRFEVAF
jgi:general secretion pathway protein B